MRGFVLLALGTLVAWRGEAQARSASGDSAAADRVHVSLALSARQVSVSRSPDGTALFRGATRGGNPGEPALPRQSIRVLLPPDADPRTVRASLISPAASEISGVWDVSPVPPCAPCGPAEGLRPPVAAGTALRDPAAYGSNKFFPSAHLGRVFSGFRREWCLAEVEFFPFLYNPVTKRLRQLSGGKLVVTFRRAPHAGRSPARGGAAAGALRKGVALSVENFDELAAEYPLPAAAQPAPASAPGYVVVTTSFVQSNSVELAAFLNSKQDRGFDVTVATEQTWGGGTGDAAAENIRAWLAAHYASLNAQYVLLIGNPNPANGDVPMKLCRPLIGDPEPDGCPTDSYYAELTGNWDLDGDHKFAEYLHDRGTGGADRNYEVAVGRIPFYGVISDLDEILRGIVRYENTSPSNAVWRKRALLPMEPLDAGTPAYQLGEEIKNSVLIPAGGWTFHRLYDASHSLVPPPETVPCTRDNVAAAWSKEDTGAAFWCTHGTETSAIDVMDLVHAKALDDRHPAFVFQCSCLNAHPESADNLAYALLKKGAVSTIGATRVSWYFIGQTSFIGSPCALGMTYEYAARLIQGELPAGDALQGLKTDVAPTTDTTWMNYLTFNLYGCPDVGLYTFGPPEQPDRFAWNAIAAPQEAGMPFPVSVTAFDYSGNVVTGFTGPAGLTGQAGWGPWDVGEDPYDWRYPMAAIYEDARTQVIYLSGELDGPATLSELALDVVTIPPESMNNWTIRMKHTSLNAYPASPVWEGTGWTTVYTNDETIQSTGWVVFAFQTPFPYDGTNNLMVDFSFNNTTWGDDGECRGSVTVKYRSLCYETDSEYGDPLAWSGPASPEPTRTAMLPNLRLFSPTPRSTVKLAAPVTGFFAAGAWTGTVAVMAAGGDVFLQASDGAGNAGDSNPFGVVGDSDGDGMPDWWETGNALNKTNPADAAIDSDEDGLINLREYFCGTHPWIAASCLRFASVERDASGFVVRFATEEGRCYAVDWTDDLLSGVWIQLITNVEGTGGNVAVPDPGAAGHPFRVYRVRLL
ncbi:MAG: hypothetical protein HQ559_13140 [Lentisphaerae bacterium]|nr:hypothetical protein [Lentisphaerota bacterium]